MKICVVGAGAIGGLLAVRLAEAGEELTIVDQGAHLQAIQRDGLKLLMADGSEHLTRSLEATASMGDVGPQDVVILAVKTQILPVIARQLGLGIVIGKQCRDVSEADAGDHVFGYTCINDVTAVELISKDATFAQWTRAKSFDTFGVFGPVVATGLDPSTLSIRTVLNDQERQNYPVSDMIFAPLEIVSLISRDMTLHPGDVICCGTSVGVGSMKPGSTIAVTIEGIGTLANRYEG